MGRAARHISGQVILYAETITDSMKRAIEEVGRRRKVQLEYNKKYRITPKSITKPIREKLIEREEKEGLPSGRRWIASLPQRLFNTG